MAILFPPLHMIGRFAGNGRDQVLIRERRHLHRLSDGIFGIIITNDERGSHGSLDPGLYREHPGIHAMDTGEAGFFKI